MQRRLLLKYLRRENVENRRGVAEKTSGFVSHHPAERTGGVSSRAITEIDHDGVDFVRSEFGHVGELGDNVRGGADEYSRAENFRGVNCERYSWRMMVEGLVG